MNTTFKCKKFHCNRMKLPDLGVIGRKYFHQTSLWNKSFFFRTGIRIDGLDFERFYTKYFLNK